MLVKEENSERMCSFYVNDYHLEMILVPYINKKMEEQKNVEIISEKDLKESVELLISKMNLQEDRKEKILKLDWNKKNEPITEKSSLIIIGTEEYIKEKNNEIKALNINNCSILDCYNFDEIKENINNIIKQYDKSLNTLGFNKI